MAAGVTMREVIGAVEFMFSEKAAGRVEMPPKIGVHTRPDAFTHAMPAYIPALNSAGMKWVSGYPQNQEKRVPYINGLLILNDPETGAPVALMDCVWITAMRTGAATAVAAKHLARPDSKNVGILGCGVQGRSNLEALRELFPIEMVSAYDIRPEASLEFADKVSKALQVDVVSVSDPKQAVSDHDIVITAGPILKIPHATIKAGWLSAGSFASLVDYDSYWSPEAFTEIDKFCTDDVPQLEQYRRIGYFQHIPSIYGDLAELVAGEKHGRQSAAERTMTCNLGIALDDMAVAPLVLQRAIERGIGNRLPL